MRDIVVGQDPKSGVIDSELMESGTRAGFSAVQNSFRKMNKAHTGLRGDGVG